MNLSIGWFDCLEFEYKLTYMYKYLHDMIGATQTCLGFYFVGDWNLNLTFEFVIFENFVPSRIH